MKTFLIWIADETYCDGLHNNMWIGMVQAFDDDLQAFFCTHRAGSDLITNVHDHAPFLGYIFLARRFFYKQNEKHEWDE